MERAMTSKLCTIPVAVALALAANAAMAANTQVHKPVQTHVTHVAHAGLARSGMHYASGAGSRYLPGVSYPPKYYESLNYGIGQIGQFLQSVANGTPMPSTEIQLARNIARWRAAHHIGGTYYFSDE
jgi:hypothetical protein